MSTINEHITIPKNISYENDLDFEYLRKKGIEYIESLGGNLWTDYNTHDPGVTILEMLCYAISDLGNRISLPMEDLLTPENGASFETQFFKAEKILVSRPVSELDYRKLFMDIKEVRNCWLSIHKKKVFVNCKDNYLTYNENVLGSLEDNYRNDFELKGLYDLVVDFDLSDDFEEGTVAYDKEIECIKEKIRKVYHENRNLCEDLVEINATPTQEVAVCSILELEREADENLVKAQILFAIENYFSPEVNFYSLQEMQEKGYRTDEIFDGPLLKRGFIDSEELLKSTLRSEVRLSDIMNIVSSIPGVKVIEDMSIGFCDGTETDDWLICIDDGVRPTLCEKSLFSFKKDVLPLFISDKDVEEKLAELRLERDKNRDKSTFNNKLSVPQGKFVNADWYTTIQNDFPENYGITEAGLPSTATTERKAQAKQLKAYLLFFDQILASYFSQLGAVRDLLSSNKTLSQTYFTQAVSGVKGLEDLVEDYDLTDREILTDQLFDGLENTTSRRNQLLDHLISRFAEKFFEYSFIMKSIYGTASDELIVEAKQNFLSDYASVSPNRGGAFNYYKQAKKDLWDTENVSGAQHRIVRLTGFKKDDFQRRSLTKSPVQIYGLKNADNEDVFRWRIKNGDNQTVLSSTEDYATIDQATEEMYLAIFQMIQTTNTEVDNWENFEDDVPIGNIEIKKSKTNKYSFNVINKIGKDPDYIIARHFKTYTSLVEFKEVLISILNFFKHEFSEEGIYLVEHILLRPNVNLDKIPLDEFYPIHVEDCDDCACMDPYSYRVSIILPGYTQRFSNMDFRDFLENLIREELPSHIVAKICWIGERLGQVKDEENDLLNFEKAYKEFLEKRTNLEQAHDPASLKALISVLTELNTIYPSGRLHDCKSNSLEGKIILGRTNLGTLK